MKSKYRISVPGFYSVQKYGRVRGLGNDNLAEPDAWKIRTVNGELKVYKPNSITANAPAMAGDPAHHSGGM